MRILVSAGGTGGHIVPALSVANELINKHSCTIYWLGGGGMESKIVQDAGIIFKSCGIVALRGKGFARKLIYPLILARAVLSSLIYIIKIKPDATFTTGGYSAVPGVLGSVLMGKPIFLQEQNTQSGWASRLISRFAQVVYLGLAKPTDSLSFDKSPLQTTSTFSNSKYVLSGNPTPLERIDFDAPFASIKERYLSRKDDLRIFVTGGSQGAAVLNEIVPKFVQMLAAKDADSDLAIQLWHQSGEGKRDEVELAYQSLSSKVANKGMAKKKDKLKSVRVDEFLSSPAEAYKWADIVIARAGALSISEICLAGVAAIFVPYPFAADNHQLKNALSLGDAAFVIEQKDFTLATLDKLMANFIPAVASISSKRDSKRDKVSLDNKLNECRMLLMEKAQALRKFAKPDATKKIAEDIMMRLKKEETYAT